MEQLDHAQFVTRHKDHLIQKVNNGASIASDLHKKDLIPDEMKSQISAAGNSQDQMRLLFKALEKAKDTTRVKSDFYRILLDLEPYVVIDLGSNFVDYYKDHLMWMVTDVMPITYELFYDELYHTMNSQHQMRLLYERLDSEGKKAKLDFFRILLDLKPDIVSYLDFSHILEHDELHNLAGRLSELKEELRKAKETNQSPSTSPGGQQETQTPSQKDSEGIEEMEMESLLGPERGGRV
ncbi:uncharacterized protein [Salvelinus alpinus]|uniref:uncharacterized protein isoform X2 n=1 Tax=Salvelinus alpinus TaxID=8036 RepID=UPI0039FC78EE